MKSRFVPKLAMIMAVIGLITTTAPPAFGQSLDSPTSSAPSGPSPSPTSPGDAGRATLSVSPAIVNDTADPGKTFTLQVTLSNVSDNPLAVHASASGLVPDQKVDPQYEAAYDASSWFKLGEPDFLLLAGQSQVEDVTISIPKDAEPGGHYATVYFESFSPEQSSGAATTAIDARVGVLALLVVNGGIHEHAVAEGPIVTQGFQGEAGPTSFNLALKNDGNVHLLPYGNVVVRNIFGQKVKTMPIPLGILLPGTTRQYQVTWNHGLLFGVYKASASITVGSQKYQIQPTSSRFILFPLVIVIPLALLLVVVGIVALVWRRKRRRRRNVRVSQPEQPEPEPEESGSGHEESEGSPEA